MADRDADRSPYGEPSRVPPVGETRAPGMDHDLYPYRRRGEAPFLALPDEGRLALTVTIVLDHWEVAPPADANRDPRVVSPLGTFFPDWLTWSQREYGARVGIFRLLDVLDRFGVVPSVAIGAGAIQRYPDLVDEVLRRGACLLAHGTHATRRITSQMSEADERALIEAGRDAVTRAQGRPPAGWCGQDFNESPRTTALLADTGFHYTTDWSNDDLPYRFASGLVSLPAHSEWNDFEAMWLRRVAPADWADALAEACTLLRDEARPGQGGVMNVALHPFVVGQAHRIGSLASALRRMLGLAGVRVMTSDRVAALAAAALVPRSPQGA